jgi:uncharacterized protein
MRFSWHDAKAVKNLKDHGVSFEEAQTVWDDPLCRELADDLHSFDEVRYYCIGRSAQGRLLIVSWTPRADAQGEIVHLISVREMTPREKRLYESSDDFA